MGSPGNIEIRYLTSTAEKPYEAVCFYTHWLVASLPEIVQRAIRRDVRWHDPTYLARIVFCELVKGNENGETGFGIAPYAENGGIAIVIDMPSQSIEIPDVGRWSFAEYASLDIDAVIAAAESDDE